MQKNVNPVDKNSPEYLLKQIAGGRYSLLLILIFTVVNLVLLLVDSDRYFLFSASVPYYFTAFGIGMDSALSGGIGTFTITALVISLLILAVYLLCWILSKKRTGWLTAALVLFCVDTVGLLFLSYIFKTSNLLDFLLPGPMPPLTARARKSGNRSAVHTAASGFGSGGYLVLGKDYFPSSLSSISQTPHIYMMPRARSYRP